MFKKLALALILIVLLAGAIKVNSNVQKLQNEVVETQSQIQGILDERIDLVDQKADM